VAMLLKAQGSVVRRRRGEAPCVASLKEENNAMPVVRVIVREGQEKRHHEAQASMHTPDRTLRITRNQDCIAAL
jgi:hypothetical protein